MQRDAAAAQLGYGGELFYSYSLTSEQVEDDVI